MLILLAAQKVFFYFLDVGMEKFKFTYHIFVIIRISE